MSALWMGLSALPKATSSPYSQLPTTVAQPTTQVSACRLLLMLIKKVVQPVAGTQHVPAEMGQDVV